MAIQMGVVSFNVPTGAVGTTQNVTGFQDKDAANFDPNAFVFYWSGKVTDVDALGSGDLTHGVGFAASATDRRVVFGHAQDGGIDSSADNGHRADSVVVTMVAADGTLDGILDIDAYITNGCRVIVDDQFALAHRVHVLGIGGLTNQQTLLFNTPITGTPPFTQNITTANFQADIVLFSGLWTASVDPPATRIGVSVFMGGAVSSTQRGVALAAIEDAQMADDSAAYAISTECIAVVNPANANAIAERGDFVGFTSNGFDISWLEISTAAANRVACLLLQGGSWAVGNLVTKTDTTDITVGSLGFEPAGGMLLSCGRAASTADTPTADAELSIGAWSAPTVRGVHSIYSDDAADPMIVGTGVEFDEVYINVTAALDQLDGLMDIKSRDANGATFVMDDTDPSAMFVWYFMGGNIASTFPLPSDIHQKRQWAGYRM